MTEATKEIANKWKNGEIIWSVSLGGLGPSYEQTIQILLFELVARWDERQPLVCLDKFSDEWHLHVAKVSEELHKKLFFSGNQVSAAAKTAWQFLHLGYEVMATKIPPDRKIQVSRYFPSLDPVSPGAKLEIVK